MLNALYLSFTEYDLLSPPQFVGFANYVALPTDDDFLHSLQVTFIYVFGTVIPVWFLSFGLALLLQKARVFSRAAGAPCSFCRPSCRCSP